jgi:DNA-binding winged helix-turn-helix (wHTH) protein
MMSFPPFRVDWESERIWRHEEELYLRRKPFAILRHLAKNPQRLVSHAEIIEAVWGKIAMSESLLRTHIRDLRRVLGDEIVETVPGRGYRFAAQAEYLDGQAAAPSDERTVGVSTGVAVVGRDSEVAALGAALRTVKERRRAAVFITGEAGVGKTTLVDHCLQLFGAQGPVIVGRGACVERYGSGQAYLPVLEAIASMCRGRFGDRAMDVMAKHAPTWLAQMPDLIRGDRLDEVQRRAAGATQARFLRELAEALEALSADAPVVMVLEDLHWTDPSTAELLAILCNRRDPARLLVLGTYRPAEVQRGDPLTKVVGELTAHRCASTMALEAFDPDTLDAYLARRFPSHRFPPSLASTLHRATAGNPLFVATLVDDLVAQGTIRKQGGGWDLLTDVDDVARRRPAGVLRLIDTQIDRLSAMEQRILEAASVAGATFPVGVVAHALDTDPDGVDSCCESLADERGLLHYVGTETWPDGTIQSRYGFRHALFQHAALARISSASVRVWHRRIAERLEAGYDGREEQVSAELAVHFEQAQSPAKAASHFASAGARAVRRLGFREGVAHAERAFALLAALPEGPEREVVELRASLALGNGLLPVRGGEAAIPLLQRARELAVRHQDAARHAHATLCLQECHLLSGSDLRQLADDAPALAKLLDPVCDPLLRARAIAVESSVAMLRGHFEEGRLVLGLPRPGEEKELDLASASPPPGALAIWALVAWLLGYPDAAVRLVHEAHQVAEAGDNPFMMAFAVATSALVHALRGEAVEARELATQSLAMAEQGSFGVALVKHRACTVRRWAEAELGLIESEDQVEEWVKQPAEVSVAGSTAESALFIAGCLRLSRDDQAMGESATALALIERTDERWFEPEIHRLRGEAAKARDGAVAERSIRTAIEIARKQSSLSLELRAMASLHSISSDADKEQVREDIRRLLSRFDEGLDTRDLADARAIAEG